MGTIVMQSDKVIEAATKVIAAIEGKRLARDEESIAYVMGSKRGWFNRYYPTREQAIRILNTSDFWGWRSMYAWGDLDKAKALLKLAQHGDPVTLNEEDVRVLF